MGASVPLANWHKIPELMKEYLTSLNKPGKDLIEDLAKTHATFEQIHPFSDGNGRTGRLLLLAQALLAGKVPPLVVKERRYAYFKYLEIAQTKQKYEPLELFISESVQFCYRLLSKPA
jgi:Fic family protein